MFQWRRNLLGVVWMSLLCNIVSANTLASPMLRYVYPTAGQIDEDSVFALFFNQKVQSTSLLKHVSCLVDGIGEQIPIRVLSDEEREQLFKTATLSWTSNDEKIALVQCTRQLPADTKVSLFIASGLEGENGKVTSKSFTYNYQVREPFNISFSCEQVNPKAACSPLGMVHIDFSSPVPKSSAQKVQLLVNGHVVQPVKDSVEEASLIDSWHFRGPFPPKSTIQVIIPEALRDDAGRPLANADKFPLKRTFDNYPPLLKFATGNFGIIESYAHTSPGISLKKQPALIPLTVRNIEKKLLASEIYRSGKVTELSTKNDAQVRKWLGLIPKLERTLISKQNFSRLLDGLAPEYKEQAEELDSRTLSVLQQQKGIRQYTLPSFKQMENETEVIGLPVKAAGFYVFEARSPLLGEQLTYNAQPMYVRTTALVTNMSVHLKTSKKGALIWVTRLDDAKVIPDVSVRLSDCQNQEIAVGKTDANGIFRFDGKLPELVDCTYDHTYMASARMSANHPMSYGMADYSFAFSNWNNGIENWQFKVDDGYVYHDGEESHLLIHPVLGRTLLQAGETIHIKHLIRRQVSNGMTSPVVDTNLPNKVVFSIDALDEEIELPLKWITAPNGGVYAETIWTIPTTAKKGIYTIKYHQDDKQVKLLNPEVHFQVEEFKVPFLQGNIQVSSDVQQGNILVHPKRMTATVQLNYIAGGAAAELPVELSAVLVPGTFQLRNTDNTVFGDELADIGERKVFLNKKRVVLDTNGHAQIVVDNIPDFKGKADIILEATFMDPNGQIQTISQTVPIVSSGVIVGIRGDNYIEAGKDYTAEIIAVDALGQPQVDKNIVLNAIKENTNIVRKRLVGGFYAVDSHTTVDDLGTLCQGKTDAHGILKCTLSWPTTGALVLAAHTQDDQGQAYVTRRSLWVYKGFNWYASNDTDRVDVISDKASYRAGEEAIFDVKIPFREATALVSIERDHIIDYQVVHFEKNSSTFKLKIQPEWAPNVFVSVLSVRGRIRENINDVEAVSVDNTADVRGVNTFIDLAKPSFRLGVAQINVENPDSHMNIDVHLDKKVYQVRDKAKIHITVKRANGEKANYANVAVFVVDKALLELTKNNTDDVLAAMLPNQRWAVYTATAQGEVVGRRHYGRKAVPAGGGGGFTPTRELFDTLLFWKANSVLDENGETDIAFQLNDSISQFEVIVVADDGHAVFGSQRADFATKQDLQLISGLPTLIRDTDRFDAVVTLHNTTDKDMTVLVKGNVKKEGREILALAEKEITLYAGRSSKAIWPIDRLSLNDTEREQILDWYFEAKELNKTDTVENDSVGVAEESSVSVPIKVSAPVIAQDKIHVQQRLIAYVPLTVRDSQLLRLSADSEDVQLPVQPPTRAISINNKIRGGVQVQIQKSLNTSLSGVKRYFAAYPYSCFEQRASVAMGLQNQEAWNTLMQEANNYLDDKGLMRYYPSSQLQGSPLLNAYILSIAADAKALGWPFEIPQTLQERMLEGLTNVVLGKLSSQQDWIPIADRTDYNLTLLSALARYHQVTESMLEAYPLTDTYSEIGLVNLYTIYRTLPSHQYDTTLASLRQRILDKMVRQADSLVFKNTTDLDHLWWLMDDSKSIHAKLLLAVVYDSAWEKDIPYLIHGLVASQFRGQWGMTTNNLLGSLATHAFSRAFEKVPAVGEVNVKLADQDHIVAQEWNGLSLDQTIVIPWETKKSADMQLALKGKGTVWATVSSLAAVEPVESVFAGYRVDKLIEPVSRRIAGQWSVGDIYRVHLRITSEAPMNWVVVNDPIPSGATILGSGLGRDSIISSQLDEKLVNGNDTYANYVEPSYIERKADAYRAYYQLMDKGETTLEYTVRLNNVGKFSLPSTRVEAMYAPAIFGEAVNNDIQVKAP